MAALFLVIYVLVMYIIRNREQKNKYVQSDMDKLQTISSDVEPVRNILADLDQERLPPSRSSNDEDADARKSGENSYEMDSIFSSGLTLTNSSEGIIAMPDIDVNGQDAKKNYAKEVQDDNNTLHDPENGETGNMSQQEMNTIGNV